MSAPQAPSSTGSHRQKRMGPAPFASFEDLSDELESPDDKNAAGSVVRLPGIREDVTPSSPAVVEKATTEFVYSGISLVGAAVSPPSGAMSSISTPQSSARLSLQTSSTPRIDISRASSSSHHDSRDSTPERELFEGHDPASAKLGLGFREEGALDLRSSTEELDFQEQKEKEKKKGKTRPQSPCLHDDSYQNHQRKDSQCSDIGLLSISGRTSRISSIGSQGSAQSRLSNASHLSVLSGQSGISRSPSPHKMLLETSFCGAKPRNHSRTATEQPGTKVEAEDMEKVLLSRKHDPTEAILAEGIHMVSRSESARLPPEKPTRKIERRVQSVKSDITIKVDKPPVSDSNNVPKLPRRIVAQSGVEYIYIPLKGPLPIDPDAPKTTTSTTYNKQKLRETKSATIQSKTSIANSNKDIQIVKAKSATPSPIVQKRDEHPKYIRIKLKPDYMYSQDESTKDKQKPDSLELNKTNQKQSKTDLYSEISVQIEPVRSDITVISTSTTDQVKSITSTPSASPKLSRHVVKENVESKTPSPSLSRRSSFASIFRSRETIMSPESPTVPSGRRKSTITGILKDASDNIRQRSRSRSKSRDRDKASLSAAPSSTESIDSKSKQKSVFSIFRAKKTEKCSKSDLESSSPEILPNLEAIAKVEFKFNDSSSKATKKYYETPLEGNSIRIPLHSPSHCESSRSILQELKTSSQDSQDTVIEAVTKHVDAIIEVAPPTSESNTAVQSSKPDLKQRQQSSSSSENVVFSTKLGNNNEVFSTKLPKDKQKQPESIISPQKSTVALENGHIETEIPVPKQVSTHVSIEKLEGKSNEKIIDEKVIETKINKLERKRSIKNDVKTVEIETKETKTLEKQLSTATVASNRNSVMSSLGDEERNSSESERDSEVDFPRNKKDLDLKLDLEFTEPERKGLVLQQDSFEDELPYIPTTLPLERSAAVPIVPVKQRSTFEMKTCPIERPRSTTPINPSCLEEYCEEVMGGFNTESVTKQIEKLKISLPRHDSVEYKVKSPRKLGSSTNWFEFAEKGISTGRRSSLTKEGDTPPPLPPKGVQKEWINFEEIPEKRKPPKRIQTIPSRGHIDVPDSILQDNVVYNYVNPEECKCECHEISAREREKREDKNVSEQVTVQEDEVPLLEDDPIEDDRIDTVDRIKLEVVSDRRSVISDSSVDLSMCVEQPDPTGADTLGTPFTSDLGLSSNRSSIVSQDEPQSPDSESPNAFPKIS